MKRGIALLQIVDAPLAIGGCDHPSLFVINLSELKSAEKRNTYKITIGFSDSSVISDFLPRIEVTYGTHSKHPIGGPNAG